MLTPDGALDPLDTGGAPAVMVGNNWWDLGSQTLGDVYNIELARIKAGMAGANAAPGGVIPNTSEKNIPPGSGGLFPSTASTPGGQPQAMRNFDATLSGLTSSVGSMLPVLVLALVGLAIFKAIRK